jgi:hypothetical protein
MRKPTTKGLHYPKYVGGERERKNNGQGTRVGRLDALRSLVLR